MSSIDAMDVVEQEKKQDSEIIMTAIKPGYSFEWNELLFETKAPYIFHDVRLNLEREVIFDFWKNEFDIYKNIHFSNKNIHYFTSEGYCIPFLLKFENINDVVERSGRDNDRNHYLRPTALIQTGLIHDVFAEFVDKICRDLKVQYNEVVDNVRFQLKCLQKLPINRVVYFRNLIVCFEKVKQILYRGRNQHHLIVRVLASEVLLNKKK